ncbi:uncharacterized protein L969DRAFT_87075 [Mixia osmundae IAM 14324]|uniref:uncharacterized protein n=1 Tax=Mixia osmundae (strain CBS 9802 / IAM 14324 / JCM 22182 / KY 12970) TaxID=764103 RepID=UPI0004A551C8|nr:uncharacterized protein L969DRAFT_87075 [Mixia osmundae IAM 14324]KEI40423.1 hypothetical protein L969DRAFT_87075 [Mixia osmundae IAM 14324]
MSHDTELYDVLELPPDSEQDAIKKAYRRLAMIHHPDKNTTGDHSQFQKIQAAYEILSDPHKRSRYDAVGLEGLQRGAGPSSAPDQGDLQDFFEMFFGRPGAEQTMRRRAMNQVVHVQVTLEESFTGVTKTFDLERQRICKTCGGTGARQNAKLRRCGRCSGEGEIAQHTLHGPEMYYVSMIRCAICKGTGHRVREQDLCAGCKGAETVEDKLKLDVPLERGIQDGHRIIRESEGDEKAELEPGDLIFRITLSHHPAFSLLIDGGLFCNVTLTLSEALFGFSRLILIHLDGRGLRASMPDMGRPGHRILRSGDLVKIRNEGMPRPDRSPQGDLYLRIQLDLPDPAFIAARRAQGLTACRSCLTK